MRCMQCGRDMCGESVFYNYFDEPICQQCAVADSHGDICPHCGKKVPFDYMAGNFCRKCVEEEELS